MLPIATIFDKAECQISLMTCSDLMRKEGREITGLRNREKGTRTRMMRGLASSLQRISLLTKLMMIFRDRMERMKCTARKILHLQGSEEQVNKGKIEGLKLTWMMK